METISKPETTANEWAAEFTTFGYYDPGFIHLRVNTYEDLTELSQLPALSSFPAWTSTFLHEYVHFLQDITTTHGLLNFLQSIELLKNANKQVRDSTASSFSIPLRLNNDFNWETNKKLKQIYKGLETPNGLPAPRIDYLSYAASIERITTNGGATISVPKYHIKYYDHGAQVEMSCHFGSIHIKEYMAHAVQNQFSPSTAHDDLPYLVAELIVKKEVPKLAEFPALIIALCDASLMDFHPARLFFHTIEQMKAAPDNIPLDVDSVYAFAFKDLKLEFKGTTQTIESMYDETAKLAVELIRDSLKADIFKCNVQWFEHLLAEAGKLRLNGRGFFSRLVSSSSVFSPLFTEVINALGIPFTTNIESKGYFMPPRKLKGLSIQPYLPKVFQAVSFTFAGRCDCSLHDFCRAISEINLTDDSCLKQPWMRVHRPDLCPYAQMWRTWGLQNKTPLPSGAAN